GIDNNRNPKTNQRAVRLSFISVSWSFLLRLTFGAHAIAPKRTKFANPTQKRPACLYVIDLERLVEL
ncbi:MAG: hypothetical protein WA881_17735, partial [Candidatus Sulfotelmatobacter sp.]